MIRCSKCNSSLPKEARFCGVCGTKIAEQKKKPSVAAMKSMEEGIAESRLYGRTEILRKAVRLAGFASEGWGQMLHIVAQPGMGGTSILQEIHKVLGKSEFDCFCIEGKPEYKQLTLYPIKQVIKHFAGIVPSDSSGQVDEKLESLSRYGLKSYDIKRISELMQPDKPLEEGRIPDLKNRLKSLKAAILRLILTVSTQKSLLISLDNVHWLDKFTLDLVEILKNNLKHRHIFIVVASREEIEKKPDDNIHQARLEKISGRDILYLAREYMQADPLPIDLEERIISDCDGNPLALKMFLDLLQDKGWLTLKNKKWKVSDRLHDYKVPQDLKAIVLERLENLQPHLLDLLRLVAVFSKESSVSALLSQYSHKKHLAEDAEELIERHWLKASKVGKKEGYTFFHDYLAESILESIPTVILQQIHTSVGAYFQRNEPSEPREKNTLVIMHSSQCESDKYHLLHFLERSGHRLYERLHFGLAAACLEKSARMVEKILRENPGSARFYKRKQSYILYSLAKCHLALKQSAKAYEELRHVVGISDEYDLKLLAIDALLLLSQINQGEKPVEGRRNFLSQALRRAQDLDSPYYLSLVKQALGSFYGERGEFDEGREYFQEAEDAAQVCEKDIDEGFRWSHILSFERGKLEFMRGDLHHANIYLQKASEDSARIKDRVTLEKALEQLSLLFSEKRMADRSVEFSERGLDVARKLGDRPAMASFCYRLGCFNQSLGNLDEAYAYYRDAAELSRELGWTDQTGKSEAALEKLKEGMQE